MNRQHHAQQKTALTQQFTGLLTVGVATLNYVLTKVHFLGARSGWQVGLYSVVTTAGVSLVLKQRCTQLDASSFCD